MNKSYRVIIIGGGPAGLTGGLYCARSGLTVLLVEAGVIGGQLTSAERIDNYPGLPQGISGIELGRRMHEQGTGCGLETLFVAVTGLVPGVPRQIRGGKRGAFSGYLVSTSEGDFMAESVIIASGSQFRKLNVAGEAELVGKGVSYCATCDAPFFRGKAVAVVGGGDTAVSEAIDLSKFASKVSIIHRRDKLRASKDCRKKPRESQKSTWCGTPW